MIDSFRLNALKTSEGDLQKANYLLDCSVAEYYTRLKDRKAYVEWNNAEIKKQMK